MRNFAAAKLNAPSPVGIFVEDVSPFGFIDMAGNVWEWCWDRFSEDYYMYCFKEGIVIDPLGAEKGSYRALRGGSWLNEARNLRCADRDRYHPVSRDDCIGFRLVLSPRSSDL